MSELQIRLFGGLEIRRDGQPLPLPTPQRISVLSYLLIFATRMHPRIFVAGLFWGDVPDKKARKNLNGVLYELRRDLDPPDTPPAASLLLADNNHLGYNAQATAWIDVHRFQSLLAGTPTLEHKLEAVHLYTGPLLPGVYDEWLGLERDRLHALFCQAASDLLTHYKAIAAWESAIEMAQRLLAADPLQEETTRELMKLYFRLGRRNDALLLYRSLEKRLAADLEVPPQQATTDLYELIWAGGFSAEGASATASPATLLGGSSPAKTGWEDPGLRLSDLPLLGRDRERQQLTNWLNAPRGTQPPMLLLEGEAGVGKSSLIHWAAAEAYGQSIFVLEGRYHEMAAPLPYGGLIEALRKGLRLSGSPPLDPIWLSEVSRLLPELAIMHPTLPSRVALAPDDERIRLFEALVQYLLALGSTGPHLVVLEDVQWIDPASLDLLEYMLPRLMGGGFRLLATARSEDLADRPTLLKLLDTLSGNRVLARMPVQRLAADAIIELVRLAIGQNYPPHRFGTRLWEETQGNPYFAVETLRLWAERGILQRQSDGEWRTPNASRDTYYAELPTPTSVRRVLLQRLQRLGRGARALLEVGAVLGDLVPESLLWRASESSPKAVLAPAEELLQRQLWVEQPDGYGFAHNKVREVVYETISGPRKRYLHGLAAAALEAERPDNIEGLAHHYSLAEDWEHAWPHLLAAARRAHASSAYQQTISYYERTMLALDRLPAGTLSKEEVTAQRFDILTERPEFYHAVGRLEAAQADFDALLNLARAGGRPDWLALAYTRQARFLTEQGLYPEALVAANESLGAARRGLHDAPAEEIMRAEVQYLTIISRIHVRAGNDAAALAAGAQALEYYRQLGDRQGEAEALNQYGAVRGRCGDVDQATELLRAALALARQLGDRRLEGRILNNLGIYASDPEETINLMRRFLAISEEIGDLLAQRTVHYNLAEMMLRFGRYAEAQEHAEQIIALAANVNDTHARAEGLILRGQVWQALGKFDQARAEITRGLGLLQKVDSPLSLMWAQLDLGHLFLEAGEWQSALANVEASYKQWQALNQPYGADMAARFHAALAQANQGRRRVGKARALVDAALTTLAANDSAERIGWLDPSVSVLARCYTVLDAIGPEHKAIEVLEQAHSRLLAVAGRCGPTLRQSYLEVVPECRVIRAAWDRYQSGRDESGPAAGKKVKARREQILLLLHDAEARGETLDDDQLARIFNKDARTIQRDLAALRKAGRLPS